MEQTDEDMNKHDNHDINAQNLLEHPEPVNIADTQDNDVTDTTANQNSEMDDAIPVKLLNKPVLTDAMVHHK